jgi:hypothetical protein
MIHSELGPSSWSRHNTAVPGCTCTSSGMDLSARCVGLVQHASAERRLQMPWVQFRTTTSSVSCRTECTRAVCLAYWSAQRRCFIMSMICPKPFACVSFGAFLSITTTFWFPPVRLWPADWTQTISRSWTCNSPTNGQLRYVAGVGGVLQGHGKFPGEKRLSFSFKVTTEAVLCTYNSASGCLQNNRRGGSAVPTAQWPDESLSRAGRGLSSHSHGGDLAWCCNQQRKLLASCCTEVRQNLARIFVFTSSLKWCLAGLTLISVWWIAYALPSADAVLRLVHGADPFGQRERRLLSLSFRLRVHIGLSVKNRIN